MRRDLIAPAVLGTLAAVLAAVAVVGALTLRERSAGVTLACVVAAGALAAIHQVWEGRHP